MPRPLNDRNFGNAADTSIKIRYHNGSASVVGYIVKQLGTKRFRVTTNGTATFDVELAQNTSLAGTLTAGYATIRVTPHGGSTENIMKLTAKTAFTTQGSKVAWQYAASSLAGQGVIEKNT
jgi:hypothetical protein